MFYLISRLRSFFVSFFLVLLLCCRWLRKRIERTRVTACNFIFPNFRLSHLGFKENIKRAFSYKMQSAVQHCVAWLTRLQCGSSLLTQPYFTLLSHFSSFRNKSINYQFQNETNKMLEHWQKRLSEMKCSARSIQRYKKMSGGEENGK